MNKKKKKKRKPKPTADAHSFVSRWNPRAPFGLVVLYVNPQSLTTYTHTLSVHHTSYQLHAARKDISRHGTSCALHSGISTSHLPEDQHLSRISATPFHGFVFTTDGSLASLMPGTGFSRVLLCRSDLCSR